MSRYITGNDLGIEALQDTIAALEKQMHSKDDRISNQHSTIVKFKEQIIALEADSVHGWRSCIDHIIRPDSPCPVCRIEELIREWESQAEQYHKAHQRWCKKPPPAASGRNVSRALRDQCRAHAQQLKDARNRGESDD